MAAPAFDREAVRAFEHTRWQRAAAVYEGTFAGATRPFIEPLLDAAEVVRGTRLLDLACGPGFLASAAHGRAAVVRGLDFSSEMLAAARAREPTIRFDEADAEALPYPDASFDAVAANFGVHHVPRPALVLREAYRVLCPRGRVAVSFWADPRETIAWTLVLDAVARHGDPAAAQTPAPGGGFGTAAQCDAALATAGFQACATRLVRATWRHRDARQLVDALAAGTARMGAVLEAQSPSALAAIVREIDHQAGDYRAEAGIDVPIAAFIAVGIRPSGPL